MKLKGLIIAVMLIFISCQNKKEAVSNFEKGVESFEKGEYFDAEKYFLKADKGDYDKSLTYLIKIYEKEKDVKKIRPIFNLIKEKPEIAFSLGYEYLYGDEDLEKNEAKAKAMFEAGARQKDLMSYLALGNIYEYGLGVDKNYGKAKNYYEKSGLNDELKGTLGQNFLTYIEGLRYELGMGGPKDLDKAKEIYKQAMKDGNRDAYTRLGLIQIKEKKTERHVKNGLAYLEKAWELGDKNAIIGLGKIYLQGITVTRDVDKAKTYFQKGTESEIREAYGYLAHIELFESSSLVIDYAAVKEIADKGAKLKDGNSYKILGYLYQNGLGVKKNERTAEKYYVKAIESGDLIDNLVYWYLGNLYFYGSKRVQNNEKALSNYLIASEYYEASAYEVGLIYENGYGVDIDIEKAKEYYKKASNMVPKAEERYQILLKGLPKEEEKPKQE